MKNVFQNSVISAILLASTSACSTVNNVYGDATARTTSDTTNTIAALEVPNTNWAKNTKNMSFTDTQTTCLHLRDIYRNVARTLEKFDAKMARLQKAPNTSLTEFRIFNQQYNLHVPNLQVWKDYAETGISHLSMRAYRTQNSNPEVNHIAPGTCTLNMLK